MTDYIVEARKVVKKYGSFTALDQVDITVKPGEIYGLVGDNGAGKTTFMKLLTGQCFLDEGELALFGTHLPKEMERQRKRTGAMVETPGFYPQLTVERNLEYYRIQKGIPGKKLVEETLKTVGLYEKRKKKGRDLSMGMKQRLGMAIALLGEPELLILDEPINGLDPTGIIEMRSLLLRLNREKNITILLSSHILSELEQIATVYGFLSNGRLMEQISGENLVKKCQSFIEIQVSDPERYAALLEKQLQHNAYQVLPEHVIHILEPTREIEAYSQLAMEHKIVVSRLEKQKASLEDYYMNLKMGGHRGC